MIITNMRIFEKKATKNWWTNRCNLLGRSMFKNWSTL